MKTAPTPIPTPASTGLDRETVTARLLDIVCKRTGYPAEMLGLDLDLEADLGIDSIKRVEILGMLGRGQRRSDTQRGDGETDQHQVVARHY